MKFKTLKDVDVKNKKILVRVDFNVPLDEFGNVFDDTRIVKALPTIKYLLDKDAKIILMSHLGRPQGKVVESLRLDPVARRLSMLLNDQVLALKSTVGLEVERAVEGMEYGDIILLENTRFYPEEENNDENFSQKLASLADIFVNDAFGTAHRAHASTVGVAKLIPAVAGLLMEREIKEISSLTENPARPFVAVIGGAKISTKITVINKLLKIVDYLLIGGALANTVLKAAGKDIGKSLIEEKMLKKVEKLAKSGNKKLKIPIDAIVAKRGDNEAYSKIAKIGEIEKNYAIYDIGPETIEEYIGFIMKSKTVIWNGPMGMFEAAQFARGTNSIAKAVAESNSNSIIGGGETLEAVSKLALTDKVSFVSTGGGAMLKFLEGSKLPALELLKK